MNDTSSLWIVASASPIIHYIYQPRREFAEFINYFASACDLWLDLVQIVGVGTLIQLILKKLGWEKHISIGITNDRVAQVGQKINNLNTELQKHKTFIDSSLRKHKVTVDCELKKLKVAIDLRYHTLESRITDSQF